MTKTKLSAALRAAFPHTIPIMTGYLAVGLAYGVLMASKGYNALWSGFVSAFAFCGSGQPPAPPPGGQPPCATAAARRS